MPAHALTRACALWQVRGWLDELIDDIELDLTPPPPLSTYEVDRLSTIVTNKQLLLMLAQGELASAVSACKSAALQASLRCDVEKAGRELEEAQRDLESAHASRC